MSGLPGRLVLLGHPLGHSFSPRFQNAALSRAAIPLTYELLDVPRSALDDTLGLLRRQRAAGNVTVPYKELVHEQCDRLSQTARDVGAVNTFWTAVDGAFVGDNTDVAGFNAAIRQMYDGRAPAGEIALIGAGGAAAAALYAMKGWEGARVRVYSRTPARAERLVDRIGAVATVVDSAERAMQGAGLLVNATPVGLHDDATPIDMNALPPGIAVFDIVYRAGGTALVRAAKARGHAAVDGSVMLVEQGAQAFERWFGIVPDRQAMWEALEQDR